jgi:hypothetical protein
MDYMSRMARTLRAASLRLADASLTAVRSFIGPRLDRLQLRTYAARVRLDRETQEWPRETDRLADEAALVGEVSRDDLDRAIENDRVDIR